MTFAEALDHCRRFVRRDAMPAPDSGLEGTGLSNSPRRSTLDTAIVLSLQDYEALLVLRDTIIHTDDARLLKEIMP